MLDVLIKGGEVYDGTGGKSIKANIGVKEGKIVEISNATYDAKNVLDATSLIVSPGFVDLHTHSDFTLAANGRAESQVHQGVTTEVVGQCGVSCAPARSNSDIALMSPGFIEGAVNANWRSFGDYLDHLDKTPLGVNVAAFVGHGTIHRAVVGDALRPADEDEMDKMAILLDESIEGGAYGFSTGLEYWPGSLASPDQLADLAKVAAKHDVLYATHVRNRDLFYDLGFGEAISTARAANAKLQISHIQPKFGAPEYAMQHAIDMCEQARGHGVDVAFDVIPHDWSHTHVIAILPQWAREGGVEKVRERLKDNAIREKIKRNPRPMWRLVNSNGWNKIVLMQSEANKDLVGMSFDDIGRRRNTNPYDAVFDLLLEEEAVNMNHLMWTSQSFNNGDIKLALEQPECAVISDTQALAPYGCLKHHIGSLSGYGWAARFLSHYVREQGILTLEEGIRRITSLPAERVGITNRGFIQEGAAADITVFDATLIKSHASVKTPRKYATGIAHVLVNGGICMHNGARTEVDSGKVLRPN